MPESLTVNDEIAKEIQALKSKKKNSSGIKGRALTSEMEESHR